MSENGCLNVSALERLAGREGWAICARWPLILRQFAAGLAASVEFDVNEHRYIGKVFNYGHIRENLAANPTLSEALGWCEAQAGAVLERRAQRAEKGKRGQ